MRGRKWRPLVVPAALVVTSLVVFACGDDEEDLPPCGAVPAGECVKCLDEDEVSCAGTPGCFYEEESDRCDEAIA